MMQMLSAGGLPILTDFERKPDIDNPRGYFEWEPVKQLPKNPSLIDQAEGKSVFSGPEPYVTFPFSSLSGACDGSNCPLGVSPEYAFASSNPEVGDFVSPQGGLNPEGRRPTDPRSGFFCAKSPGATTISITAGGLSYSEPIVVTEGESGEGCRLPEPAPPRVFAPAAVETHASEPAPTEPASPPPHQAPTPGAGVTPSPAPTHPAPNPTPQAPPTVAPAGTSVPTSTAPPAVSPVVSPHPPPGVQPAPPTGVSSQPVPQPSPQPGTQPVGEIANAPAPAAAPAPGFAPGQAAEGEAAIQRQHLAVAAPRGARPAGTVAAAMSSAGSWDPPLVGVMGAVALLALAGGVSVGLARRDRRAYAAESLRR